MIRASALYMSVVVSLLIVLICGAMLMAGYIWRMQNKVEERRTRLENNLKSGVAMILSADFPADTAIITALYEGETDSISISKNAWGLYEQGSVKAWIGTDTVVNTFLIAALPDDSTKVFFLSDEDRPISISGKSLIKGTAYLPKAGIKAAYVEGQAYDDKRLVYGSIKDSERKLPALQQVRLDKLLAFVDRVMRGEELKGVGGMTLLADSAITIGADFNLRNALVVGHSVHIEEGYKGQLQVIATDSIVVGDRVVLEYPSALVVLKNDTLGFQRLLKVGKDSEIGGQLICWEKGRSELMPLVSVGERTVIKGELYSQGYVSLGRGAAVDGTVSAVRLMARVSGALYENYLIDVKLDRSRRSKYYLSPSLLNQKPKSSKILCWLK